MLQFRDCPQCGKRIRLDASQCHRCKAAVSRFDTLTDEGSSEAHLAEGGYTADFDYDQFVQEEFGERRSRPKRIWFWVAWLMIVLTLLGGLFIF